MSALDARPRASAAMIDSFKALFVCPICQSEVTLVDEEFRCSTHADAHRYPVLGGLPILISENLSTFSLSSYDDGQLKREKNGLRRRLRSLIPRISLNLAAKKNFMELRRLLLLEHPRPQVLILGGAEVGAGMKDFLADERIQCLETDIAVGSRTQMVCDASYVPLRSESIDAIIIQAVLEYIPDPARTVAEIHRVLKPRGIVHSEMPFMQNVHGGRYDFTRLTHLGHLRLYRDFEEIDSGPCAGPGCALAWMLQHFLLAFVAGSRQRDAVKVISGLLFFWLKYFDYALARTPGGLDAATGTYVLARKGSRTKSDREIIQRYRGAVPVAGVL